MISLRLGPSFMDPNWLLENFGGTFLWISLIIIFVECGLFFPFLPGDSLLFALGLFISGEKIDVLGIGNPFAGVLVAMTLLTIAAFAGNVAGYEIGRKIGPPIYERDGRILKRKYFETTEKFFAKHGNKALVIGRFVPFVRTYITVVAGVTQMDRSPVLPLERHRCRAVGPEHHAARLLPRSDLPGTGRQHRLRDHRDLGSRSCRSPTRRSSTAGTSTCTDRTPEASQGTQELHLGSAGLLERLALVDVEVPDVEAFDLHLPVGALGDLLDR